MVTYSVYKVSFQTRKGTQRQYVGMTRCMDLRKVFHNHSPPAWMKCAKGPPGEWQYEMLKTGIATKHEALAVEALESQMFT